MAPENLRILFISMCGPEHFAGLGYDLIQTFEQNGHTIDYLTTYQSKHPAVIGLFPAPKPPLTQRIKQRFPFLTFLQPVIRFFRPDKAPPIPYIHKNGLVLVSPNEEEPAIDISLIVSKIKPIYDVVLVHIWQDMLTSKTLQAIYDKLHVPMILLAADMQPLTGGCYYFGECRNFTHGCGTCPILDSTDPNDVTHTNFTFKKHVYASINCAFVGNTHINQFARQSGMFSEKQLMSGTYVMDKDIFIPLDATVCRRTLGLPTEKKYILFSRYAGSNHATKGNEYLIDSINRLAETLNAQQKAETLLVLAGATNKQFERQFNIDVMNVGFLTRDQLINAYSAATLFISTSIDDAGPSMVNQSLMCGTPVVAFEIGTAIDAVINGKTGYKAPLKDSEAFSDGIHRILQLSPAEHATMRTHCRTFAEEHYSFAAYANNVVSIYKQLKAQYKTP